MFLRNLLKPNIVSLPLKIQIRNARPVIKIGPDRFEVTVDCREYTRYEIRVKAHNKYVLVEGKQERDTEDGYVLRKFAKKFKLPAGCDPEDMTATFSPEGYLKIEAKRRYYEPHLTTETYVPIVFSDGTQEEAILLKAKKKMDYCKKYPKVMTKRIVPVNQAQDQASAQSPGVPPPQSPSTPTSKYPPKCKPKG